jgi:hypothetical protein
MRFLWDSFLATLQVYLLCIVVLICILGIIGLVQGPEALIRMWEAGQ